MTVRPLAAALLAAGSFGLAACGGEPAGQAAGRSGAPDAKTKRAALDFARCMREQGIDLPDPVFDRTAGGPRRVAGDATPEELRRAERACARYRDAIKPPQLSQEQQQEFKQAALAHARCMREHGIDFPDPTFSEGGGASIRLRKGDVDPEDADFKAAEKACQKHLEAVRP